MNEYIFTMYFSVHNSALFVECHLWWLEELSYEFSEFSEFLLSGPPTSRFAFWRLNEKVSFAVRVDLSLMQIGHVWVLTCYKTKLEQLLFLAAMNLQLMQFQMLLVSAALRTGFQEHSSLTFQLMFVSFFYDPKHRFKNV